MSNTTDPVKDAITEARKRQILDAAAQVFAEKGFHRAKVKDIARTAGVADGTIYNYFANKNALIVAMIDQLGELDDFATNSLAISAEAGPTEILQFMMQNRMALLARRRELILAILPQVMNDADLSALFGERLLKPSMMQMEQVWAAQQADGQIRDDVPPALIARLPLAMFFGLIFLESLEDPVILQNWSTMQTLITEVLQRGVQPVSSEKA